jgi:hypothetical protein
MTNSEREAFEEFLDDVVASVQDKILYTKRDTDSEQNLALMGAKLRVLQKIENYLYFELGNN